MPFPVALTYIEATAEQLSVTFPPIFVSRMQKDNGGVIDTGKIAFQLVPFLDSSSTKRIRRTSNHITQETLNARKWKGFPDNAVVIGDEGSGNLYVLLHSGEGKLEETIYCWNHETGNTRKVANTLLELDKRRKKAPVRKKSSTSQRQKLSSLELPGIHLSKIPAPWKLFQTGDQYTFQMGKNADISAELVPVIAAESWNDSAYFNEVWEKKTQMKLATELSQELLHEEFEEAEIAIYKVEKWTTVLIGVRPKIENEWSLLLRTEKARFKADLNELKNLLRQWRELTHN